MTTLRLNAASPAFSVPGFGRVGAFLSFIFEVFGEAQNEMRKASRKYPFAGV